MNLLTHYTPFIAYVRQVAHEKRQSAGYNGEWNDGGAQALEDVADAFKAGLAGNVPAALAKHHSEFTKVNDPDYAKYLELKAKFA
jgi:argininosuccinate synthase